MAKDPREKENKRLEKAAKKARRKQTRGQMWQAFQLQRKRDKKLVPLMLLGLLVPVALLLLLSIVFGAWWFNLVIGLLIGAVVAMIIF